MKTLTIVVFCLAGFFLLFYPPQINAQSCISSQKNVHTFCYKGKTYKVVKEKKTWSSAASCAVKLGGQLVHINSQAEQDTVYGSIIRGAGVPKNYTSVYNGGNVAYVWTGGTDKATEGTWLWDGDDDGKGVNFWKGQGNNGSGGGSAVKSRYNNWGGSSKGTPNEPDDYLNNQDAAAIGLEAWPSGWGTLGIAGEWNDINTANSLYYVVEVPNVTNQTLSICRGDSILIGGKYRKSQGKYYDTFTAYNGCDSIRATILSIPEIDTAVSRQGKILTAVDTGAHYQWLDCDKGFAPISEATNRSFTPIEKGHYAVAIIKKHCSDTSSCYRISGSGINLQKEKRITVFPNPATNNINLQWSNRDPVQKVTLYTLSGSVIKYTKPEFPGPDQLKLHIETLKPGFYLIGIQTQEGSIFRKIYKQ